jgi:arylsulfatase A-like enzyme
VPENYLKLYPGDKRAQYKALISHLDAAAGEILDRLKALHLENETLVIFTSDNGGTGQRNGSLRGGKATLWEGGLRIPFLARWPGHIPWGTVRDDFATTLEFLPTFAPPPKGVKLDGFDLMPTLEGKAKSPRTAMFWQQQSNRAARAGNWKWVDAKYGKGLFDLAADSGEKHDLSAEKPGVLAMIESRWQAWRNEMDASPPRGPFRDY